MTHSKKGGARIVLPPQYFDPTIEYPTNYTTGTMVFDSPATYQQVEVLNGCGIQPYNQHVGGAYHTIVNPITNRKVSIHSKLGKRIINTYLSHLK